MNPQPKIVPPDAAGILGAIVIEVAARHGVTPENLMRPRSGPAARAREEAMARVADACPDLMLRAIAGLFGIGGNAPAREVCRRITAYRRRVRAAEDAASGRRRPGRSGEVPEGPPTGLAFGAFDMHPRALRPDCRPDPLQWAADKARWRGAAPGLPATGHSSIEASGHLEPASRRYARP